ncbi:MAG TPA: hypothetical protein VFW60_01720 [Rhodanobacteraceae bacterium]|nr:hypothetical protein [Rhodanobacteraceae bacterium]
MRIASQYATVTTNLQNASHWSIAMSTTILPPSTDSAGLGGIRLGVFLVLAIWFVLVVLLGAKGAFLGRPGVPPVGMAIGFTAPLLIFFAWLRLSRTLRDFVLSLDLRLMAGMQAWRFAGLGFLFLYAYKVLPGMFALPAGLGDMAVSLAAPWMILGLARDPDFAASAAFVRWNWLGILDLVVALGLGASMAMAAQGTISTTPMATLPLLIVPAFLVPLFLMLHAAALMQSRRMRRST